MTPIQLEISEERIQHIFLAIIAEVAAREDHLMLTQLREALSQVKFFHGKPTFQLKVGEEEINIDIDEINQLITHIEANPQEFIDMEGMIPLLTCLDFEQIWTTIESIAKTLQIKSDIHLLKSTLQKGVAQLLSKFLIKETQTKFALIVDKMTGELNIEQQNV